MAKQAVTLESLRKTLPILEIGEGRFMPQDLVEGAEILEGRVRLILALPQPILSQGALIQQSYGEALEKAYPGVSVEFLLTHHRASGALSRRKPQGVKALLPVVSGKGGVGKSLVAVNLAFALAQNGLKVGILDLDIYGPSLPFMLGLKEQPDQQEGFFIPLERAGVKALSMGMLIPPEKAALWRGPLVQKAVAQLLFSTRWGDLDVLVIDTPPGTGDIHLALTQLADLAGGVVVTTPQFLARLDVQKSLSMFETLGVPLWGVVENMASFECPHCHQPSELFPPAAAGAGPLLARLPFDRALAASAEEGTPLVLTSARYAEIFGHIVQVLKARLL